MSTLQTLTEALRPALPEVGSVLRARTRSDDTGRELGTFTAATRPTDVAVEDYVDQSVVEMELRLGKVSDVGVRLQPFARRLVAYRVGMSIELSYEPDNVDGDGSAYVRLRELYEAGMGQLLEALTEDTGTTRRGARITSVQLTAPDGLNDPIGWPT